MRTKITIAVLVAVLAFYCGLVAWKGIGLIAGGGMVAVPLGIALVISAVLAIGLTWREIDFGRRTSALAHALATEGALPADDLPRRPSGRVDRAAADVVFERRRAEAEADPGSWQAWYRLALAYDAAGDRTRARQAARHALELYSDERT